ncbi:MAG: site-specific integrase [Bacteroidota bacterium]
MEVSFNIRLHTSEKMDSGKSPIVLQISWREFDKPKLRRKRLGISCHETEWDREEHRVKDSAWRYAKKNALIEEALEKAEEVYREYFQFRWDYKEFAQLFVQGKKATTLTSFTLQLIEDHNRRDKGGTAIYYGNVLKAVQKFARKKDIMFEEIDHSFLKRFERYHTDRGFSGMRNMRGLKALFGKAIEDRIIDMKLMPFKCGYNPIGYKFTHLNKIKSKRNNPNRIKRLSPSQVSLVLKFVSDEPAYEKAMDLWKFSYFTMGVNLKDIALMKISDIKDGIWYYDREKTGMGGNGKPLLPECLAIIKKYHNPANKYVFYDILRDCYDVNDLSIKSRVRDYSCNLRRRYVSISKILGLEGYFTFYSARYTSSTIAVQRDGSLKAVQHLLDHASIKTTDHYIGYSNHGKMLETLELLRV